MRPPSYVRSVVDRNVVMLRMTVVEGTFMICAVHRVSLREPREEDEMGGECGMRGRKDKFI